MEKAIQSERERLNLPPLRRNAALDKLASRLALRISEDGELDFDAPSGEELLALARESGYRALVVQALFAVDAADGCEIVQQWNRDLAPSEVYRRHEARDAGIGVGWLQDMTAYVLLVGVPPTPNPSRRRELGTAPHEYPIADLVRLVNRRRGAVGLPELGRDPGLDAVAQREAFRVLSESAATDETLGYRTEGGVTFVYARVANNLARDFRPSVDRWFQFYRDELLRRDAIACGAGIASREVGERLEAVLVLALSPR